MFVPRLVLYLRRWLRSSRERRCRRSVTENNKHDVTADAVTEADGAQRRRYKTMVMVWRGTQEGSSTAEMRKGAAAQTGSAEVFFFAQ